MSRVFKRTISGINNQNKFYKVDFIVFLEGGNLQFSKDEVYNGKYNSETEDIIFWKNMFKTFVNGKKIKFKSVGSKETVKDISVDIIKGNIQTVLVAMDNEFDEILNKRIIHPNVYYTHGYSWENDVWCDIVIKNIIEELTAIKITHSDISTNFNNLLKDLKLAVYADGFLFKNNSSFFPRKKSHLFCVDCTPTYLPSIKKEEIDKIIAQKGLNKGTLYSYGSKHLKNTKKFCYGHFLADYCCQIILNYIKKKHSIKNIPKKVFYRMAINKFFNITFKTTDIYNYYQLQFSRNIA